MDGTVEHSSGEPAATGAPPAIEVEAPSDFSSETEAFVADFQRAEPALEPDFDLDAPESEPELAAEPAAIEPAPEGEIFASEENQLETFDVAPPEPAPAEEADLFAESLEEDGVPAATVVYKAPGAVSDSPDLSDIAKFGNSDASGTRDGNLRYDVMISGIDTADVRLALREALTDRKFLWDVDQILRGLRSGSVRIPNVSPAKAHILVARLRSLPVKVRWEQYAIQQI